MRVILLASLCLSLHLLNAQNFNPTAVEGAHWIMIGKSNKDLPYDDIGFSYTVKGDSTVNGKSYKKFYREIFRKNNTTQQFYFPYQIESSQLVGFMRDEASSKRTFFQKASNASLTGCSFAGEYTLFDFSYDVGDKLDMNSCVQDKQGYIPTIASKVNGYYPSFDDKIRVTYFFIEPDLPNKLIEGIGYNSVGLFYYPVLQHFIYLKEYCVGSNLQCGLIINDLPPIMQHVVRIVTPNGMVELPFEAKAERLHVEVSNILGQVQLRNTLTNLSDDVVVDDLDDGFYVVSVSSSTSVLAVKKFVIVR